MLLRLIDVPEARTKIPTAKKEGKPALRGHYHPNIHIQPLFINTFTYGNRYSLLQQMQLQRNPFILHLLGSAESTG